MNDQIIHHIINFLSRKETPEDIRQLKEWLDTDPVHHEELRKWLVLWDATDMVENTDKYHQDDAYRRFMFRLKRDASVDSVSGKDRRRLYINNVRKIVAVFIVSFSLGVFSHVYFAGKMPADVAYIENIVPLGSKSEIKLPDGSIVWLNAGSALRYPADYGKTSRDIYLEGEGYFKVARQEKKTFTVHTAAMKIKALGTEFNVKAYPGEVAETMLIEGEILVDKGEGETVIQHPVVLKPGQKFSAGKSKEKANEEMDTTAGRQKTAVIPSPVIRQLTPAVTKAEASWKERNWRIESEELQSLVIKMERRYDVKFEIEESLKKYRFTGTIKDESLEQVLMAMQLTSPILFEVQGKKVSIYMDNKKSKLNN
ncbi:MAG: FecR family protein [Dysgonamonadaceae bacterium]|jgi:ferric-dicitrate binding protein FerR (iron transport regulator)|nr:FecR family protein [Dysgonamonadaceae bacterium]